MSIMNDMRRILPLLQSFGISPETLGEETLEKIMSVTDKITHTSQITPEITRDLMNCLGVKAGGLKQPPKKNKDIVKIGRNEKCLCESGKKYKKCCGQV